jgi:hypothetical protein
VTIQPVARDERLTESKTAAKAAEPLPSADEVVARYLRAIGGEAAVERLKTIEWRGQQTGINRMSQQQAFDVEIYQAAPNRRVVVTRRQGGAFYEGFDGATAWASGARGPRRLDSDDAARIKQEAEFFWFLKLRESYPGMRVLGKEQVEGRDAFAVGATSRTDSREKLYFDAETGLLIRRYVTYKTSFGSLPEVTDFSDYRDAGGVKLPFLISYSRAPVTTTWKFTGVKVNLPIEDAKFKPPAGK